MVLVLHWADAATQLIYTVGCIEELNLQQNADFGMSELLHEFSLII